MESIGKKAAQAAANCSCGRHNEIRLEPIVVEAGAIHQAADWLRDNAYKRLIVAADDNTYAAAGQQLCKLLQIAGLHVDTVLIQPDEQGDVIADERAVVQLMLAVPGNATDAIIAVGSGTVHDIVRIVAFKMKLPFVSIPTAPSVDGFTSIGAPLIVRGMKTTISAVAPAAIFADLDILRKAPSPLIAAGFGDMLGKATSLFDWRFGVLTADEPYCEAAELLTRDAWTAIVEHIDQIASKSEEGIRILMNALIESGLAMLLFGQSHCASGAEHHLSHYWEMDYLRRGKRQLLHGAKVGVACALVSELYRSSEWPRTPRIEAHREELAVELAKLPDAETLRGWLAAVGGPTTPEQIGVDEQLIARSLQEAHHVRLNRQTLLRAMNESAAR